MTLHHLRKTILYKHNKQSNQTSKQPPSRSVITTTTRVPALVARRPQARPGTAPRGFEWPIELVETRLTLPINLPTTMTAMTDFLKVLHDRYTFSNDALKHFVLSLAGELSD